MSEKLSNLTASDALDGLAETPRERLQAATLEPVVTFFIRANQAVGIGVFGLAVLEHFWPMGRESIVTEKVLIALIGGLTLQVGAVIIAAFKGLFDHGGSGEADARVAYARNKSTPEEPKA